MKKSDLIRPSHLQRTAYIYVRQSSARQVRENLESQQRQYELAGLARQFGWADSAIVTIDDDLGRSGASTAGRVGFDRLIGDVALKRAGIIIGLEVSRLARNNRDWYQLLELCALTGTLIADADGVYNPALFNDRMLLGLKGTMSEAELHLLRSRLVNGLFHKAEKGQLQFKLPAGFEFDEDGRMIQARDEQVRHITGLIFEKFFEIRSVHGVTKYLREEGLRLPCRGSRYRSVVWRTPTYHQLYIMLKNPLYAGAYVFGRTRTVHQANEQGQAVTKRETLPQGEWRVLLLEHHPAYITWPQFEMIQQQIAQNAPALKNQSGQAVREGGALLQGLARCGHCGRAMHVGYSHRKNGRRRHSYICHGAQRGNGLPICQSVTGRRLDQLVVETLLEIIQPAGLDVHLLALQEVKQQQEAVLIQLQMEVERARFEADRAQRQFNAVEPENRLVARTLEREWNESLARLNEAESRLQTRRQACAEQLSKSEAEDIGRLAGDLSALWHAPTTTDRDRKQLLRAAVSEVQLRKAAGQVQIKILWIGGAVTDLTLATTPQKGCRQETADAVELIRQLAVQLDDGQIARVLNRRGLKTSSGLTFNAARVARLRREHDIPSAPPPAEAGGQTFTVEQAAQRLEVSGPTIYKWLADGLLSGRQIMVGAPWQIRLTETDIARLTAADAPEGWLTIPQAAQKLAVSVQTVYNWVKSQKLAFVYVNKGRRKGLRVNADAVFSTQPSLFV